MSADFERIFKTAPSGFSRTPGRVNLIGEHTDYNGGMVLPTAIAPDLTVQIRERTDQQINVSSDRFDGILTGTVGQSPQNHWADYVIGTISLAQTEGLLSSGVDVRICSTIPDGAGLSSSAALTVGLLKAIRDSRKSDQSDVSLAKLARRVENEYMGVPCGIMDQMAVALAPTGHALALDTKNLSYDLVTLPTDYHFAVIHSGVTRKLNDGQYTARKEECDAAKSVFGENDLCLIPETKLSEIDHLPNSIIKRVRHCISEHQRTVAAKDALKSRNIAQLGQLMNESHTSLRDDFEVSTPEIDELVKDAVELGAIGARLTGGGFGGCIVACVQPAQIETWQSNLLTKHPNAAFIC